MWRDKMRFNAGPLVNIIGYVHIRLVDKSKSIFLSDEIPFQYYNDYVVHTISPSIIVLEDHQKDDNSIKTISLYGENLNDYDLSCCKVSKDVTPAFTYLTPRWFVNYLMGSMKLAF